MRTPSYRLHRASGQAVVTILGRDHYLGVFDSPESHRRYGEAIAAFKATGLAPARPDAAPVNVRDAVDRFRSARWPELPDRDRAHFLPVLHHLVELLGPTPLGELGPVRYEAVRQAFVDRGWSRRYVNSQAGRLKQFLRWCCTREFGDAARLAAIREVQDLRAGQTAAPERPPRTAVDGKLVAKTLPHLPAPVRGLVELQFWTGCRPGEAVVCRATDVNTAGVVVLPDGSSRKLKGLWVYTPPAHKGTWRGHARYVMIGPRGQRALRPYLDAAGSYLFRPADVAKAVRAGECYRTDSYARALSVGCTRAKVPGWSAYQLRHRVAVLVRDRFGHEHAAEVLGHVPPGVTGGYTKVGVEKAAEAMRVLG